MRKRVVFYFPHNPLPAKTGAHQRCLAILKGLIEAGVSTCFLSSEEHADSPWSTASIEDLRKLGVDEVKVYTRSRLDNLERRLESWCLAASRTKPTIATSPRCFHSLRRWFRNASEDFQPDSILMSYVFADQLVPHRRWDGLRLVMDSHDVASVNSELRRRISGLLKIASTGADSSQLLDESSDLWTVTPIDALEMDCYNRYHSTICISRRETELVRVHARNTRAIWLPMLPQASGSVGRATGRPVYSASSNPFNIQGAMHLRDRILPLVVPREPNFSLTVTGSIPAEYIRNPVIRHVGYVNCLTDIYSDSSFFVNPTFSGTGQQVKMVEAMAHGLPVICYSQAAIASPVVHLVNGLIAKNAAEFAEYVSLLWKDKELCAQLGNSAFETIREERETHNYSRRLTSILFETS